VQHLMWSSYGVPSSYGGSYKKYSSEIMHLQDARQQSIVSDQWSY